MNGIYVENIRYEFFTELSLMSNGNIIHTAYKLYNINQKNRLFRYISSFLIKISKYSLYNYIMFHNCIIISSDQYTMYNKNSIFFFIKPSNTRISYHNMKKEIDWKKEYLVHINFVDLTFLSLPHAPLYYKRKERGNFALSGQRLRLPEKGARWLLVVQLVKSFTLKVPVAVSHSHFRRAPIARFFYEPFSLRRRRQLEDFTRSGDSKRMNIYSGIKNARVRYLFLCKIWDVWFIVMTKLLINFTLLRNFLFYLFVWWKTAIKILNEKNWKY